jgi:putative peptidoglycan lipid II flippase
MKKNLLKSIFSFSFMTVISRITGLLRDMIFAYYFGASAEMDAFNVAYRIPNFLRSLFAEGAFSQAFIPILSEYREKRDPDEVKIFLNHIAGLLLLVLFILTVIAILAAPYLVYAFAPGFIHDPHRFALTSVMLRITFPYILFVSLTAYIGGILNAYGKFGIPAFAPSLLNLALIGAAIFLARILPNQYKRLLGEFLLAGRRNLFFNYRFCVD